MDKVKCLNPWDPNGIRQYDTTGCFATLGANSNGGQNRQGVCFSITNHDAIAIEEATETLRSDCHGAVPIACYCFQQNQREEVRNMGEKAGALTAEAGMHNNNYLCYCIEGNIVDRVSNKNGKGWCEDVSPTLNTQDRHAVVYDGSSVTSPKNWNNPKPGDPCYSLHTDSRNYVVIAMEGNGARPSHMGKGFSEDGIMYTLNTIEQHSVCYAVDCRNNCLNMEVSSTLQAKPQGGWSVNVTNPILIAYDYQYPVLKENNK